MPAFPLAPMSRPIRILTTMALALPVLFLLLALVGLRVLLLPALLIAIVYAWIWLRFRPTAFVVHPGVLDVRWPLKRRELRRGDITDVRLVDRDALCREIGWGVRVGAGGLWGGFGWLWTTRRGIVQMYVSRGDGLVWIECARDRPWLITPAQPEAFVRALRR